MRDHRLLDFSRRHPHAGAFEEIVAASREPVEAFLVATGSTSPAETQNFIEPVSRVLPARAYSTSPRNTAGTAKNTVGLNFAKTEAITCGVGRSLHRITEAPMPIGNEKLLPSP